MLDLAMIHEPPVLLELFDDVLVGVLDVLAEEVRHGVHELAGVVQGADNILACLDHACCFANSVVALSKVGSLKLQSID